MTKISTSDPEEFGKSRAAGCGNVNFDHEGVSQDIPHADALLLTEVSPSLTIVEGSETTSEQDAENHPANTALTYDQLIKLRDNNPYDSEIQAQCEVALQELQAEKESQGTGEEMITEPATPDSGEQAVLEVAPVAAEPIIETPAIEPVIEAPIAEVVATPQPEVVAEITPVIESAPAVEATPTPEPAVIEAEITPAPAVEEVTPVIEQPAAIQETVIQSTPAPEAPESVAELVDADERNEDIIEELDAEKAQIKAALETKGMNELREYCSNVLKLNEEEYAHFKGKDDKPKLVEFILSKV